MPRSYTRRTIAAPAYPAEEYRAEPLEPAPTLIATKPTVSFIVPTKSVSAEDRPLHRCLKSIFGQMQEGDEVLVVGDTHDGPLSYVEWLVGEANQQHPSATFRYIGYDAGHHCWGHCQVNVGLSEARGSYIHCNDDDDIWLPGARDNMAKAAEMWPGRPLLFRFESYWGQTYWEEVGKFERNHIGGHCLVLPNEPDKIGSFGCAYNGDFDWLESAVNAFGGPTNAIWLYDVIAKARP